MNTSQFLRAPRRYPAVMAGCLLLGAWVHAFAQEPAPVVDSDTPEVVNNSDLNAENTLLILLGELQATQGDPGAAYAMLMEAARKTGEEALYKRAIDIALNARNGTAALDGAKAWKKAFPLSRDANRYLLQILVALNQLAESLMPLRSYIQLAPASEHVLLINGMPQLFNQTKDPELAAAVVEQALVPFVDLPTTAAASWTTIGRMRVAAKKLPQALEAVNKALAADPKAMEPGFLLLELLSQGMNEAEPILQGVLGPQSPPHMRLTYARVLMDAQRLPDAAAQLQLLNQSHPDFAEAWLVLGALHVEMGKDSLAQPALLRYIELEQNKEDANLSQAYLMLSKIAANQKKPAEAEAWLNKIDDPQALTQVQIQRAHLLASKGDMAKARALIADLPHNTPQAKRTRLQAEVQLLRDFKMYEQAYQVLSKASKAEPDDLDLRYEVAMLAEKLNRMDEMEKLLRSIIAAKPDFQHAYNALGYALADRNIRLAEARALIVKALEIAPEDPMITDSLGWVEFRLGNKQSALAILQRAYDTKNDPEIAAHLGEVQWSLGLKDKAMKVWRDALKTDPKNDLLQETLKRLKVKL